jgi:hypothetical protein
MKERPILFSAPMVRAILDGRKTQTRRVVDINKNPLFPGSNKITGKCLYGERGDQLWVRETWRGVVPINHPDHAPEYGVARYVPDKEHCKCVEYSATQEPDGEPWRPSIHMPRWASRIDLQITGIRVERLKEISDSDCKSEGYPVERSGSNIDAWLWYRSLWESINGEGSWDQNPFVWVIEFKKLTK